MYIQQAQEPHITSLFSYWCQIKVRNICGTLADVKLEKTDETPVTITCIGVASNTFQLHLVMK